MANQIVVLNSLVIPLNDTVSNPLTADDFGDADLLTVFGTAPVEGSITIQSAFVVAPTNDDWRDVGSNNHGDQDPGLKLAPSSSRTIPMAFAALRVKASQAQTQARTFPVNKRIAV